MPDYSALNVAIQVESMRNSQKLYFQLISKAKKTKLPEDFAAAKRVLEISKLQEISVDDTISDILQRKEAPHA